MSLPKRRTLKPVQGRRYSSFSDEAMTRSEYGSPVGFSFLHNSASEIALAKSLSELALRVNLESSLEVCTDSDAPNLPHSHARELQHSHVNHHSQTLARSMGDSNTYRASHLTSPPHNRSSQVPTNIEPTNTRLVSHRTLDDGRCTRTTVQRRRRATTDFSSTSSIPAGEGRIAQPKNLSSCNFQVEQAVAPLPSSTTPNNDVVNLKSTSISSSKSCTGGTLPSLKERMVQIGPDSTFAECDGNESAGAGSCVRVCEDVTMTGKNQESDTSSEAGPHLQVPTNELTPPCGPCSHWTDTVFHEKNDCVFQGLLETSSDKVLRRFFSNDPENDIHDVYLRSEETLKKYLEEYNRTPWALSAEGCCLQRELAFRTPSRTVLKIGAKTTMIQQVHRMFTASDGKLIHHTRAYPKDTLYSRSFAVDVKWEFTNVGMDWGQARCLVKVFVTVTFLRNIFVKGMIRSRTLPPAMENTLAMAQLLVDLSQQPELHNPSDICVMDGLCSGNVYSHLSFATLSSLSSFAQRILNLPILKLKGLLQSHSLTHTSNHMPRQWARLYAINQYLQHPIVYSIFVGVTVLIVSIWSMVLLRMISIQSDTSVLEKELVHLSGFIERINYQAHSPLATAWSEIADDSLIKHYGKVYAVRKNWSRILPECRYEVGTNAHEKYTDTTRHIGKSSTKSPTCKQETQESVRTVVSRLQRFF